MSPVCSSVLTPRCVLRLGIAIVFVLIVAAGTVWSEDAKTPRIDLYGDPLPPGAVARLGMLRFSSLQEDLTFSTDGKHFISCGSDGQVRVWDGDTGELKRCQRLWGKPTMSQEDQLGVPVVLAPGGALVAVWDGGNVYVYETATGKERGRLPAADSFASPLLTFSPDGKRLLVQRQENRVASPIQQLWDMSQDHKHPVLKTLSTPPLCRLSDAAFAPDGKRLAATIGNTLHFWDATSGKELVQADERYKIAGPLAFSPDGKTLAVRSSSPGWLDLVNATTLKKTATLQPPAEIKNCRLSTYAFSPDGRHLAAMYCTEGEKGHGLVLWDVVGLKVARRLANVSGVARLVFSPDGDKLAGWAGAHEVRLWETASGRLLSQQPSHEHIVPALAVSPDGKWILSGDWNRMLRLWDAVTGKPLHTQQTAVADITHCSFSPDGKRIISVCDASAEGKPGTVIFQLWDVALSKELRRFTIPKPIYQVHSVGMSADNKRLMAAVEVGRCETSTWLYVWDTDTGKLLIHRPYKTEEHTRVGAGGGNWWHKDLAAFAPDGERMSVWQGIEEVSSGSLLANLPKGIGSPVVFSADGRLLAAVSLQPMQGSPDRLLAKGLCLIETMTGEELFRRDIDGIQYVAFTPDGRGVVVAEKEKLSVWDSATGARLHQMKWPQGEEMGEEPGAYALAVLPGGRAVTSRMNGHILVWDLAPSTWPTSPPPRRLDRPTLDALWSDLSGDAPRAYRALAVLAAAPSQAVSFLKDRLQPVAPLNAERVEKLLADLGSDSFPAREAASQELAHVRYRAEPILRRALAGKPTLETRRRIDAILDGPKRPPADALRMLRAIAVLERIGTPEARRLLVKLAGGAASPETRAVEAALQRLKYR